MKIFSSRAVSVAALTFVATVAFATIPAFADGVSRPGEMVQLIAGKSFAASNVEAGPVPSVVRRAANIKVTYTGFSKAAKKAFQRAVDIWATRIDSSVTINIDASFKDLGNIDILGQAGPTGFYRDFKGAPKPNIFYPVALANKLAGKQLDTDPEILAEFNSQFSNWHFEKSPAPLGKYDFTTVVLHELGHGLGFIGAADADADIATIRIDTPPFPDIYSNFVENGSGKSILTFADPSAALRNQLVSKNLFFDSKKVRKKNNGNPAKIFAPKTFVLGTSYSHLDEKTFGQGNPNSLMTPLLGDGETIRDPGAITLAIFDSIGW